MKIVGMKFNAVDWKEMVPHAMHNTAVDLIAKGCYAS